ncbi:hypothetical protein [Myroides sp. N17-2]|uniref:hypothetical protein n=1 Tax=Myroides sp. N17-2 TaxID=2030799 RepID=UPI000EFACB48|nr:hypothetical protein [Myroides sp. N17-2]
MQRRVVIRGVFSSLPVLLVLVCLFILADGKGVFLIPFFGLITFVIYTLVYVIILGVRYCFFNTVKEENTVDRQGFWFYLVIMAIVAIMMAFIFV